MPRSTRYCTPVIWGSMAGHCAWIDGEDPTTLGKVSAGCARLWMVTCPSSAAPIAACPTPTSWMSYAVPSVNPPCGGVTATLAGAPG